MTFFTVTLRPFIKYHSPLCFQSRNITKNAETDSPLIRDVIIEQPLRTVYGNNIYLNVVFVNLLFSICYFLSKNSKIINSSQCFIASYTQATVKLLTVKLPPGRLLPPTEFPPRVGLGLGANFRGQSFKGQFSQYGQGHKCIEMYVNGVNRLDQGSKFS